MQRGEWPFPQYLNETGYHWFHSERSSEAAIAQWIGHEWHCIGEEKPITPQEIHRRGWEYLGPVTSRPHSIYLDG
jgi:hypothetical protein